MSSNPASLDDHTESVGDWLQLHGRAVAIGAAAVALLTLGGWWWRTSQVSRASHAEAAFFDAQQPLAAGDAAAAQTQLRQVAQRYAGTPGGAQAQLLVAQLLFDQGKYQDGLTVLQQASNAPAALKPAVAVMTAAGNEGLGRFADAAKGYETAAATAGTAGERAELQASAARAYQQAGDKTSAARVWGILAQLQGQGIADEARVRLGELIASPKP